MDAEDLRQGSQKRHQRRLIDITEGGMAPANDEVKLVPKDVVPACYRKVQQPGKERDAQNPRISEDSESLRMACEILR